MVHYFRLFSLALLLSVGVGSVGQAASFDCNKATTETEIAICSDPELSALDEILASLFQTKVSINFESKISKSRDQYNSIDMGMNWSDERDKKRNTGNRGVINLDIGSEIIKLDRYDGYIKLTGFSKSSGSQEFDGYCKKFNKIF